MSEATRPRQHAAPPPRGISPPQHERRNGLLDISHGWSAKGAIVNGPGELTAVEVAREFPDWDISKGTAGLWYARLRESAPPVVTCGEDPTDLRDEIRRKLAQAEHARWLDAQGWDAAE